MIDPLTALGLASNIVQLITFTSDLVSKSREYYHSVDGRLLDKLELEAITSTLQNLSSDLIVPTSEKSQVTQTERQLKELCTGCKQVTRELLALIGSLKSDGSRSRWKSFRQALRSMWQEEKINDLEKRLDRYRRQIDTTLMISLRESIEGLSKSKRTSKHVSQFVLPPQKRVKQWEVDLVDELHRGNWKARKDADLALFSAKLSMSVKVDRETLLKYHIIDSLRFNNMEDRAARIPAAHRRTFDWVFQGSSRRIREHTNRSHNLDHVDQQPQWSNFVHWLQNTSSLYWITGKPGSGKSTLMKYLQTNHRTLQYVDPWIGDCQFSTAGHFFWNSGTAFQMSKLGLLQTLLHETIRNKIDLVPTLFPERWKSYQLFGVDLHDWTMMELSHAFQLLIADDATKFLFFIDGLDEFDGDGNEIVTFLLESIRSRKNVKFCVSSRPWPVFEDAFHRRPSLRLEDLTAPDIQLFVTEQLHENKMFVRLDRLEHYEASRLIEEVRDKACGVFLWVRLVILSLLEGLTDGDTVKNLQARLLALPSDLKQLFEKMLRQLNPAYFEQASMYFQLVRAAVKPLTLLTLSFADDGIEQAISYSIKPESIEQQMFRAERMSRRLNSRCKGLLEVERGLDIPHARVQYLHRTVRDYLAEDAVWSFVASGTDESFDPNISLSSSWLLAIKTITPKLASLGYFWSSLRSCADYAIKFQNTKPSLHIRLLDELSRTSGILFDSQGHGYSNQTWLEEIVDDERNWLFSNAGKIRHWTGTEFLRPGLELGTTSFFGYAFQYPLPLYVEHKLKQNNSLLYEQIADHSLLYTAAISRNAQLVGFLLNMGAEPNMLENERTTRTTWEHILGKFWRSGGETVENPEDSAGIINLFIEHGADVRARVDNLGVDEFVGNRFGAWNAARTDELLSKIQRSRKTTKKPKSVDFRRPQPSLLSGKAPDPQLHYSERSQARDFAMPAHLQRVSGAEQRTSEHARRLPAVVYQGIPGMSMMDPRLSTVNLPATRIGSQYRSSSRSRIPR